MRTALYLLVCLVVIFTTSCKDKYQVNLDRLDGEWEIQSILSTYPDGSIARQQSGPLGSFTFKSCDYRKETTCDALRKLPSGDQIAMKFGPASGAENARVALSFLGTTDENNWLGTYDITRNGRQMTLRCEQCPPSAGGTFTIVTEKK